MLDRSSNTLFAYNDIALRIWTLIEEGRSEAEIVSEVVARWSISASRAHNDIRSIVALWRGQGLLAEDGCPPRCVEAARAPIALSSASPAKWSCTIRGTAIAFEICTELQAPIRALFRHLAIPDAAPECRMAITATSVGEYAFVEDGRERLRTHEPTIAVGALFVAVLERIRPCVQWFALLHGAALARGEHGLALAGAPGSGKSTLAAGLMDAGFDYLADDLVALSKPEGAIVPWPLPLSVKPGSMAALASRYPQLPQAKCYRTKGFDARLLLPPAETWSAEPVKLRTLIFPRFSENAAPQTQRLSSFDTLERLLTDRIWLGDPITEERVTRFLAWLDETPAYAMSFGSLDDAVRMVESVIP